MEFVHHIDDAVLPNITAEREAYTASGAAPGAPSQLMFDTDPAFLKYLMDEMLRAIVKKHGLLPPPPPTEPAWYVVTRKQGLKALARADTVGLPAPIYEADIQARIEALPETTPEETLRKNDMRIEFKDAPTWRRGNVFFETMVAAMGITPEQRDALLQLAATFQE